MKLDDFLIGEFKNTGCNYIDTEKLCVKFDRLFIVSKYKDEYTLVRFKRKDSPIYWFKTKISECQARIIITKLSLVEIKSSTFRHASTFKLKMGEE